MVTDAMGNNLEIGDLVHYKHGEVFIIGRVSEVKAGAITTPGGQMIGPGKAVRQILHPGSVSVVAVMNTALNNPEQLTMAANIIKLVDTDTKEREAFIAEHGGARRTGLLV